MTLTSRKAGLSGYKQKIACEKPITTTTTKKSFLKNKIKETIEEISSESGKLSNQWQIK